MSRSCSRQRWGPIAALHARSSPPEGRFGPNPLFVAINPTQANPKQAFAEWMLRHNKGYSNDAKVGLDCGPVLPAAAWIPAPPTDFSMLSAGD